MLSGVPAFVRIKTNGDASPALGRRGQRRVRETIEADVLIEVHSDRVHRDWRTYTDINVHSVASGLGLVRRIADNGAVLMLVAQTSRSGNNTVEAGGS